MVELPRGHVYRLDPEELITCCGEGCGAQFPQSQDWLCPACGQKNELGMTAYDCLDCGAKLLAQRQGAIVKVALCVCQASEDERRRHAEWLAGCAAAEKREADRLKQIDALRQAKRQADACYKSKEGKCKVKLIAPAWDYCSSCCKFRKEAYQRG